MSFLDFAARMFPYWSFGALMGWAVWKSDYKDLLAFDKKSFAKWFLLMLVVNTYRYYMIKLAAHSGMNLGLGPIINLPIGGTLFVGWEDLCHTLPLVILRRVIGTSKWVFPIHFLMTLMVMISFGIGHLYQGILPATLISLYIPFAVRFAQRKGFGTLIAGHMLYDFSILMAVRMALGLGL